MTNNAIFKNKKGFIFLYTILALFLFFIFVSSLFPLYSSLIKEKNTEKLNLQISTIIENKWKEISLEDYSSLKSEKKHQYLDSSFDIETIVPDNDNFFIVSKNKYKTITINIYKHNTNTLLKSITARKLPLIVNLDGEMQENGWVKLPNGQIFVWGKKYLGSIRSASNIKIDFNHFFPSKCLSVTGTLGASNSISGTITLYLKDFNSTSATFNIDNSWADYDVAQNVYIYYSALGY